MTGLILKDLLYLKRMAKVLITLLAFYMILFLQTGKDSASGILSGVIVMLTVILSSNAFAYDEAAKWRVYELSLPVSKSRIILARYLLALIFSTALTLISLLMELVALRGAVWETGTALLTAWSIALLFCAVLFPTVYKYGMQKARLMLMTFVLLPILAMTLLQKANLPLPKESVLLMTLRIFPLFAVAAYFLSYLISCRVFTHRKS